jgi:hypothetical protein
MISLEDYKKKLGYRAQLKSDAEILKIMKLQEKLADMFFDMWVEKINTAEKTTDYANKKKPIK